MTYRFAFARNRADALNQEGERTGNLQHNSGQKKGVTVAAPGEMKRHRGWTVQWEETRAGRTTRSAVLE